MKYLSVFLLVLVVAQLTMACVYDADCGSTGRCLNGQCQGGAECHINLDCRPKGLYMECSNGKCVKSTHKICVSNDDCKKNLLHKKCVNNRCT